MHNLSRLIILVVSVCLILTFSAFAQSAEDALRFIAQGDSKNPLIKSVEFENCKSSVTIDTIFLGYVTVKNNWNNAIWKSKTYNIGDNQKISVVINCKGKCSKYEGGGFTELMQMSAKLTGIDAEKIIQLDIASTPTRTDHALAVIQDQCPGVKSYF